MTQIPDPNVPVTQDAPQVPAPPNPGQSEDWENRFKGLQRTHNTLVQQVSAKDAAIAQLTAQLNDTKSSSAQALTERETHVGTLSAELNTLKSQVETERNEKSQLQKQLQQFETRTTSRQRLMEADATDLLPFFEDGDLNIDGLEGDALTTKLTGFRTRLTALAQKQFSGATPETPSPSTSQNPTGMNLEELSNWLMKPENMDSDRYDAFHATYEALVHPQK